MVCMCNPILVTTFPEWLSGTELPKTKLAKFANSVDLDKVAHDEPPHLDLHCLPSSLWIFNVILLGLNIL